MRESVRPGECRRLARVTVYGKVPKEPHDLRARGITAEHHLKVIEMLGRQREQLLAVHATGVDAVVEQVALACRQPGQLDLVCWVHVNLFESGVR